jgi:hypothetical protein
MSIRAIDWVFRQDMKSWVHKFVLVALADNAGDTGLAYPSTETISRKTNLHRSTVVRALDRLAEQGWIEDTGKRAGTTRQIKVYRLRWAEEQPKSSTEPPLKSSTEPPKGSSQLPLRVAASAERVAASYPEPSGTVSGTVRESKQLSKFIEFLIEDSRFDGLDVEVEVERAVEWCKKKNRAVTERFLENWLLHAEPPLEEDEEEVGSLAAEDYYSWDGWTEERRRALLELWPGVVEPPPRWDKLSADLKEQIETRVKEGWA